MTSTEDRAEDRLANIVLRECCQDILDHINVDQVIFRLHSKGILTSQEVGSLESISFPLEKKKQLYLLGLSDKGSAAFEGILKVLNDTAEHKPHAELADKLSKRHKHLSQRRLSPKSHSSERARDQAQDVSSKEIPTVCTERQLSDIDGDDGSDRLEPLPDVAISTQIKKVPALLVEHKVSLPKVNPGHTATAEPAANVVLSLSVGSLTSVTQLSSSIQDTSNHTTLQFPSPVKVK